MADLILDSLEIENFRAFRHLKIERLGRVNLITGKNNVGKTCLLEALRLYGTCGDPSTIVTLLRERAEWSVPEQKQIQPTALATQYRYNAALNLFHGRDALLASRPTIDIGSATNVDKRLTITMAPYSWHTLEGTTQFLPAEEEVQNIGNVIPTIELMLPVDIITSSRRFLLFPLEQDITDPSMLQRLGVRVTPGTFISIYGLTQPVINFLWDQIVLTEEEREVLQALQIIAPSIKAINLRSADAGIGDRIAFVRDSISTTPLRLRSMGDGVNRLLGISLGLVNSQNGLLLIDEVDTGLHYSVLPDIWKLIFKTADRLNIQVFATTHSWDCIQAFQDAASSNRKVEGQLIRLESQNDEVTAGGNIVTTIFDERKLAIAAREQIEVR